MKTLIKTLISAWDKFWFSKTSLQNVGLFRLVLGLTLFYIYSSRQWNLELFYTGAGLLPKELALEVFPHFFRPPFLVSIWPDSWMAFAHASLLLGLLLVAFGVGGRLLVLLTWVLNYAFWQRNFAINFGADLVGNIYLFFLIGMQPTRWYSFWHLKQVMQDGLKGRVKTLKGWCQVVERAAPLKVLSSDLATPVFVRLGQLQLCVLYFYTGIEKFKGLTWWDGTAVWQVLINSQMVIADFEWLRWLPGLIVLITWLTVLFEVYFGVLIWFKKWRPWVLLIGLSFHLSIGVLMALLSFTFVMLSAYTLFYPRKHLL